MVLLTKREEPLGAPEARISPLSRQNPSLKPNRFFPRIGPGAPSRYKRAIRTSPRVPRQSHGLRRRFFKSLADLRRIETTHSNNPERPQHPHLPDANQILRCGDCVLCPRMVFAFCSRSRSRSSLAVSAVSLERSDLAGGPIVRILPESSNTRLHRYNFRSHARRHGTQTSPRALAHFQLCPDMAEAARSLPV